MKYERFPSGCALNPSEGSSHGTLGKEGPAGGAAALAGSPQFPLGRTKESAPPSMSQSGSPMAGTDGAPTTPPVDAAHAPAAAPAGGATFSGVPVRAMEDVMAARLEQIVRFGHTPESDREIPFYHHREFTANGRRSMMRQVERQMASASEYAAYGHGKLDVTRRKLVKTAALILAAIDRIDAELESEPAPDVDEDDYPEL